MVFRVVQGVWGTVEGVQGSDGARGRLAQGGMGSDAMRQTLKIVPRLGFARLFRVQHYPKHFNPLLRPPKTP